MDKNKLEEAINLTEYLFDECERLVEFVEEHMDVISDVNHGPRKYEYVGLTQHVQEHLANVANTLRDMCGSMQMQLEEEQ